MNGWNQHFDAYRAKSNTLPRLVTRLPMAVALLLLVPAALIAVVAVLAGLVLFVVLLILWRLFSAFVPSSNSPAAPEPADGGRVNVKVVGRGE